MRLKRLRDDMLLTKHGSVRVPLDKSWHTSDEQLSLPERKALSLQMIFESMPLYIGPEELIVGSRTVYGETEESEENKSAFDYNAMPSYVNEADVEYFGFNHEFISKGHYAPDYGIVMTEGIDGTLEKLKESAKDYKTEDQKAFGKSVEIVYKGLKTLIVRYGVYAFELSLKSEGNRKKELEEISESCLNISKEPPATLREACQLFWFLYLGTIIENFQFINFGRVDQILNPYVGDETDEVLTEVIGALLLKMYDQYDLILADKNLMGRYSAQHNITIGGVTPTGEDASNAITKAILNALNHTRLPEPLVSVRVSEKSPKWLMRKACELSISGLNCMAYYNDELVVESLHLAGIKIEDARDYGFGLCQDVLIPGRGDHYCSGGANLTNILLEQMEKYKDETTSYETFFEAYKKEVVNRINHNLQGYNIWEASILDYNKGKRETFFNHVKSGAINPSEPSLGLNDAQAAKSGKEEVVEELYIQTLMSPLPFTSALYKGCIESGNDLTRFGPVNKDKGFMILGPVVAINGLAALKKLVFEDQRYSLGDVLSAMKDNWKDHEVMRQYLWHAPKWCNDDIYIDEDAVDLLSLACDTVNAMKTPSGGSHLAGIHQPHPVFAGRNIPATPEGRFSGTPIPVTLSPENGTLSKGPIEAMKSVSKIDSKRVKWNSCLMLQYYSSTFTGEDGIYKFEKVMDYYFKLGGIQHQPNVVDIEALKKAQTSPDAYKDLIIRMWGVSAHFVDLPKDVQDEFISRYDR